MPHIADNKDAFHRYEILEKFEAGISLTGHETKSAKRGGVSLKGAFVTLNDEVPYLTNAHIGSFQPQNAPAGYDPLRPRRLLVHKAEARRILGKRASEGLTMVPLSMYTKKSIIKIEVGIARTKSKKDKRETMKKREADREIRRVLRGKE